MGSVKLLAGLEKKLKEMLHELEKPLQKEIGLP